MFCVIICHLTPLLLRMHILQARNRSGSGSDLLHVHAKMATRSGHDMLSQIRGFSSKSLKNVQTEITTIEGRKVGAILRIC